MKKANAQTMLSNILGISISLLLLSPVHAQVCKEKETPQTISYGNFNFIETTNPLDGSPVSIAEDKLTKLQWDRCIYGQKWEPLSQQCIGSPMLLTWPQALQAAANSGAGWRVPNIKELNSILDLQCINPPFDLAIFPGTFASEKHGLWTSSPHVYDPGSTRTNAWYIDLSMGKLNYRDATDVNTTNFVRFVK